MDKKQLRLDMRKGRHALPLEAQQQAAANALREVERLGLLQAPQRVAIYLADRGELDPAPIVQLAWRLGCECYLPILDASGINLLSFAPYRPDSELADNYFGIPEPVHGPEDLIAGPELDLVFTPLVAFDPQLNRMGMGRGFYDRTFACRLEQASKPKLIGLAHSLQQVEDLEPEEWDVPLDMVITEEGALSR